jgi:hypothetical protein
VDSNDELMHPVGDDPSWSESYYFNFVDHEREIGMVTRMAFRANQGFADGLHIVFVGGKRVAFSYRRRDLGPGDHELSVGGLSYDLGKPFQRWSISCDGQVQDISDASILMTRRRHRPDGWFQPAELSMELHFDALAEPHDDPLGQQGHFEQTGRVTGEIRLGGESWPVDGFGVRDKSWGARPWSLPELTNVAAADTPSPIVIWSSANFAPDLALACCLTNLDGEGLRPLGGWLQREGDNRSIRRARIDTRYRSDSVLHSGFSLDAEFADGSAHDVEAEVLCVCPTKIPVPGGATFINQGLTRYRLGSHVGYGFAEYWHLLVS